MCVLHKVFSRLKEIWEYIFCVLHKVFCRLQRDLGIYILCPVQSILQVTKRSISMRDYEDLTTFTITLSYHCLKLSLAQEHMNRSLWWSRIKWSLKQLSTRTFWCLRISLKSRRICCLHLHNQGVGAILVYPSMVYSIYDYDVILNLLGNWIYEILIYDNKRGRKSYPAKSWSVKSLIINLVKYP